MELIKFINKHEDWKKMYRQKTFYANQLRGETWYDDQIIKILEDIAKK